ncbi:hypothetical protein [uncultured Legionella sp.]|uniref:hypothetical protein n=1 Tax=uncultured Legionella sp. TaxID=210934 RepID=UPI0026381152|nr:hypothetical protein [uncultured Legionella sp.]
MKDKFSRNFFSSKEKEQKDASLVSVTKERNPNKYSNKEAGSLHHYIQQETRDVLDELHGKYVIEEDYSDEENDVPYSFGLPS